MAARQGARRGVAGARRYKEAPPLCPKSREGGASVPPAPERPHPHPHPAVPPSAPSGWAQAQGVSEVPGASSAGGKGSQKPLPLRVLEILWVAQEIHGARAAERRGGAGVRAAGKAGPGGRSRREPPAALPETRLWADGAPPARCPAIPPRPWLAPAAALMSRLRGAGASGQLRGDGQARRPRGSAGLRAPRGGRGLKGVFPPPPGGRACTLGLPGREPRPLPAGPPRFCPFCAALFPVAGLGRLQPRAGTPFRSPPCMAVSPRLIPLNPEQSPCGRGVRAAPGRGARKPPLSSSALPEPALRKLLQTL